MTRFVQGNGPSVTQPMYQRAFKANRELHALTEKRVAAEHAAIQELERLLAAKRSDASICEAQLIRIDSEAAVLQALAGASSSSRIDRVRAWRSAAV